MRLFSAGLSAALLVAAACRPAATTTAPTDALMQNDFEASPGWGGGPQPSLTTDKAHSGRVSALVSPEVPFGYTFARTLGELGIGAGAQKLELSGWVMRATGGSTAKLVVQVNTSTTDETKVYYKALALADAAQKFGEWQQVTLPLELPAGAQPANQVKVYLWNDQGTAPSYLDDVALRQVK